jgi:hypothetical protein
VELRERRTNIATSSPEQKQEQTHEQDHQEQAQERHLLHLTTIEIEFGDSKEAGLCFPIVVEESKSMVSSVISSMADVYLPAALSSSPEDDTEKISMSDNDPLYAKIGTVDLLRPNNNNSNSNKQKQRKVAKTNK